MTVWYVSANTGNDSNAGTSSTTAFATLQNVVPHLNPGDKVEVMDGTYTASQSTGYVLQDWVSGTAAAPITIEAAAGAHPILSLPNGGTADVQLNCSYTTVQGFESHRRRTESHRRVGQRRQQRRQHGRLCKRHRGWLWRHAEPGRP